MTKEETIYIKKCTKLLDQALAIADHKATKSASYMEILGKYYNLVRVDSAETLLCGSDHFYKGNSGAKAYALSEDAELVAIRLCTTEWYMQYIPGLGMLVVEDGTSVFIDKTHKLCTNQMHVKEVGYNVGNSGLLSLLDLKDTNKYYCTSIRINLKQINQDHLYIVYEFLDTMGLYSRYDVRRETTIISRRGGI